MFGRRSIKDSKAEEAAAAAATAASKSRKGSEDSSSGAGGRRRSLPSLMGSLFTRKSSGTKSGETTADGEFDKDFIKQLSPLLQSVFNNYDPAKFKEMLKKKPDIAATDKQFNRNIFHWATINGRAEALQQVIELAGKDVEILINSLDCDGRSPLCLV
jgi:hypothetical protein